jgi:hypothetical protein
MAMRAMLRGPPAVHNDGLALGRRRWSALPVRRRLLPACVLLALLLLGCASADRDDARAADPPATARLDLVRKLREDLTAVRHPGDGGGRVHLVSGGAATVGQTGRWSFEFTTGPEGIAVGGMLIFQVSPFWGWSPPQSTDPDALGHTTFRTAVPGVDLEVDLLAEGMIGARVAGRALAEGDVVRIDYGDGVAGARPDRFAERGSTFWFGVDADGDGVRKLLDDCPTIDVRAGPPAQLVAHVPSVVRPGETARLVVAALDAVGDAAAPLSSDLVVEPEPGGDVDVGPVPSAAALARGHVALPITPHAAGTLRFRVTSGGLEARSNPMEVAAAAPRILWADLHGHSSYSDGTGLPEDYFAYARDVAALDVASLTDHDHWGMRPLDADRKAQHDIAEAVAAFDEPGRFVALPGYEWTSWIYGHRHVLFFDGKPAEVLSSLDPATDRPEKLWAALRGREAITVPHHTAGGPIAMDWDIPPDPRFEPVTEVVSVHGSSEAEDSPARIYSAVRGHFARDALGRGYRLGFIGSGDSHDGHPGLAYLAAPTGGLAALVGAEATRESVLATLRARRVYATSGPRIILRFAVDDVPMGGTIVGGGASPQDVFTDVIGTAPLERIDLIRSGAVVASRDDLTGDAVSLTSTIAPLAPGEYVYVRVVQRDGGLAWSSPVFAK